MVWLQAENAPTSRAHSPASVNTCPIPSPSAVGVYLERLSIEPVPVSTAAASSSPALSPTRGGGGGGGSGGSSPKGSGGRSPRAANWGNSSPKARASRGATLNSSERPGVRKNIELDGLSAYTKESTADWVAKPSDIADEDGAGHSENHRRVRPVAPGRVAAPADPGADASATSAADIPTAPAAASPGRDGRRASPRPEGKCHTAPVFILRPLRVRGSLVIHEGVTTVQASTVESGRPSTAGGAVADGGEGVAGGGGIGVGAGGGINDPPPLAAVSLDVDVVALQVDTRQYVVLNETASALLMSERRFRFRSVRPTTSVLDDPEAWWRYAIRCTTVVCWVGLRIKARQTGAMERECRSTIRREA